MAKPRSRRPSPVYLTIPNQQGQTSRPLSAFQDYLPSSLSSSRCSSANHLPPSPSTPSTMASCPPTLTDILLDVSPPPWTLSAFMAYLSQNHCMETLEFTLDSQRYAAFHNQLSFEESASQRSSAAARVCEWWDKLMQVYIVPCAPREVNLPAQVRDRLLNLPSGPYPPHPDELDEAGRIIYELMNDSLLVPFLQSVAPLQQANCHNGGHGQHHRQFRHTNHLFRQPRRSAAISPSAEFEVYSDGSDSHLPSAFSVESMTPPTTPPTEYTFNSSPGGLQRAMAAHNKGWKKVGEKLGFGRKSFSRRSTSASSSIFDL